MTKRKIWLAMGAAGAGLLFWFRRQRQQAPFSHIPRPEDPHVVILGAGFAGLEVAQNLASRLGGQAQITLIDRHNYHLFTPLLYEVAGWGLDPYNVAYPIRQMTGDKGIHFRRAVVTGVDLDGQCVQLDDDDEIPYDYLVIALGTTTNFFGNEAAEEHAYPLKWLEQGVAIRNRVIDMLERAAVSAEPADRQALLTFIVVGGGATGVEAAAALADMLRHVMASDYATLNPKEARVILIEMMDRLLPQMNEAMGSIALKKLQQIGVEVLLNTTAEEMSPDCVVLEDGRSIPSRTVLWVTGVRAPDVVTDLDAPHGKGGALEVNEYLQVGGRPNVYAAGDNAYLEDAATGESVPLLAQAAVQQGQAVAENLVRAIEGQPPVPFRYRPLGNTVSLGRAAGVVEIGGFTFNGFHGGLAWRLVHLAKIKGFRDKLATVNDWLAAYLYRLDTARLYLEPVSVRVPHREEVMEQVWQMED